jgi:hypothetical protein
MRIALQDGNLMTAVRESARHGHKACGQTEIVRRQHGEKESGRGFTDKLSSTQVQHLPARQRVVVQEWVVVPV